MIVGTRVELTCSFRSYSGALLSPDTVVCKARLRGTGTVVVLTAVEVAAGLFTAEFTPTLPGYWIVRFAGTGTTLAAASEMTLLVSTSQVD